MSALQQNFSSLSSTHALLFGVFLFAAILGGSFAHSLVLADDRTSRGASTEQNILPDGDLHPEVPFEETQNLGGNVICHVFGEVNEANRVLPYFSEGSECTEAPAPTQCSDGIDNDGNGLIDYPADLGCTSAADDDESGYAPPLTPMCSDGFDNDGDGFTDADDPNCHTDGDPTNADSYDPSKDDESGDLPVCWNGIDDDGDGQIDMDDVDCDSPLDDSEEGDAVPQCSNEQDDDGDGLIDADDPQCHTDGDATNADSYDPTINNEQEDTGGRKRWRHNSGVFKQRRRR